MRRTSPHPTLLPRSPILNDIAELPTWDRVNEGLCKMYRGEVLGKLPVVQHLCVAREGRGSVV